MKLLIHWIILTLSVLAVSQFVPGIHVNSFMTALIVGAVLAFINLIIKPIVTLLTLPINVITLGLFSLVINGFFFWIVSKIISGFEVRTFTAAVIGAFIVSILNWVGNKILIRD
jgi:putative membrane protein